MQSKVTLRSCYLKEAQMKRNNRVEVTVNIIFLVLCHMGLSIVVS